MQQPLVSVIIPTYKRPTTLETAISSVLNQTYKNIEVIIVDDNNEGSSYRKETEQFMTKYIGNSKIKYLKHKENKNGAAARNTGIRYAKGDYIAFLDDDDEFLPNKIEYQVRKLEGLSDIYGAAYCNFQRLEHNKVVKLSEKDKKDEGNLTVDLLLDKNEIAGGSTLLIRKNVLVELGGFDESFQRHQDWEFILRFFERYKIAICTEYLVKIHTNDSINKKTPYELVEIKKNFLQKFEGVISKLDTKIQCKIYSKHWIGIAKMFYLIEDYQNGKIYFKKAMNYKGVALGDMLKIFAYQSKRNPIIKLFYILIKKLLFVLRQLKMKTKVYFKV